MTREEAIKNIKEHCYFANLIPQAKEALDVAIKALEQEPKETWSIKDVATTFERHGLMTEQEPCEGCDYNEWLKGEAEPKTGHWIGRDASGTNFYGKCSCCGEEIQIDAWYTQNMNYCPNCGAKMESEDKE